MAVPLAITAGASRVEQLAVSFGHVASLRFPARLELPAQAHSEPAIAVVLSGGWVAGRHGRTHEVHREAGRARDLEAFAPSVVVEPADEPIARMFGPVETAVVSLTLEAGRFGSVVSEMLQRFLQLRDPAIELLARRAANELEEPDDVSALAVEAAALELVARVARSVGLERRPAWLGKAREVLNDRYADPLSLDDIADAVGVEPERLARGFRRAYGESLGDYLRRIRVNAAARLLAQTDEPISRVAGEVGFADQSHLTRWFARYLETTPGRYRGATRSDLIRSGNSDLLPPI